MNERPNITPTENDMNNAAIIAQAIVTRNGTMTAGNRTPIRFVLVSLDAFDVIADARGYCDIRNATDDATTVLNWAIVSFATDVDFPIIISTSPAVVVPMSDDVAIKSTGARYGSGERVRVFRGTELMLSTDSMEEAEAMAAELKAATARPPPTNKPPVSIPGR